MRLALFVAIGLGLAAIASTASAQNRPTFTASWSTSNRAQVITIDRTTRMVELQRTDGERRRVHADDSVKNLDKVQPGDTVVVAYSEVMTFVVVAPGTKLPPDEATATIDRSGGQLPSAVAREKRVVSRRVVSVEPASNTISLIDPAGGPVMPHRVADPDVQKGLARIKAGDFVIGTLVQTTAISIERPR